MSWLGSFPDSVQVRLATLLDVNPKIKNIFANSHEVAKLLGHMNNKFIWDIARTLLYVRQSCDKVTSGFSEM